MKFEEAITFLKKGKKVRRKNSGWIECYNYIYVNYSGYIVPLCKHFGDYTLKIADFDADDWEIVTEKKKVKLRDLTAEQVKKWIDENCNRGDYCKDCPFRCIECYDTFWLSCKDMFSDKFLDQEVEIEE